MQGEQNEEKEEEGGQGEHEREGERGGAAREGVKVSTRNVTDVAYQDRP